MRLASSLSSALLAVTLALALTAAAFICVWVLYVVFASFCRIWCESQKGAHNSRSGLTIIIVVSDADAVGAKSVAGSGRTSSSFSPLLFNAICGFVVNFLAFIFSLFALTLICCEGVGAVAQCNTCVLSYVFVCFSPLRCLYVILFGCVCCCCCCFRFGFF